MRRQPRDSKRRRALKIAGSAALFVLVLVVWAYYLFPIYWLIASSIKTRVDYFSMPPKWFFRPTIEHYAVQFAKPVFVRALKNSLFVTVATVVCSLGLGAWAAYAFARFRFKGSRTLGFGLIVARMMPPIVFVVPLFLMLNSLHLRNTHFGLILIFTTFTLPFSVWMLRSFFEEVPIEIEEAAFIDGASRVQTFFKIVIPLTSPGLAATAVFAALLAWNEFLFALLMGGGDTITLPVFLSGFIGERTTDVGGIMATAVLSVTPPVLFATLVQRNLIKGLTLGAVKG